MLIRARLLAFSFSLLLLPSVTTMASPLFGPTLCKYPGYTCMRVKRNQSWYSLFPDENVRDMVKRVNRLNTQPYANMLLAVPENLESATLLSLSPFPHRVRALGEKAIVVDPLYQAWGAYDAEGNLVRWGPASAGRPYCHDVEGECNTHQGAFRIYSLGNSECYSTKFPLPDGGAPMPYCMYFNGGQALHGEPNGLPGYNASHGCVRLYVNDAEWLRYSFVEGPTAANHFQGTRVIVRSY